MKTSEPQLHSESPGNVVYLHQQSSITADGDTEIEISSSDEDVTATVSRQAMLYSYKSYICKGQRKMWQTLMLA